MKTLYAIAIIVASLPAHADPKAVMQRNSPACQSKERFQEIVNYGVQGDEAAFKRSLEKGIQVGQCTFLRRGEPVFIDEVALLAGLKRVRRAGTDVTYWTYTEAVQ